MHPRKATGYESITFDWKQHLDSPASQAVVIELPRAHKPDTFKTVGTHVNIGTKRDVFVLTEEQRHRLMEYNREFLLTSPLPGAAESQIGTAQPEQLTNGNRD